MFSAPDLCLGPVGDLRALTLTTSTLLPALPCLTLPRPCLLGTPCFAGNARLVATIRHMLVLSHAPRIYCVLAQASSSSASVQATSIDDTATSCATAADCEGALGGQAACWWVGGGARQRPELLRAAPPLCSKAKPLEAERKTP